MTDKKDILEMDFGKINVPDAIALSMQAATRCWTVWPGNDGSTAKSDDERLRDLMEKLEARVQDEIDNAAKGAAPAEQEEEMFPAAAEEDVFLHKDDDGEVKQAIHKGVVFGRFCNEPVEFDHDTGKTSPCIKQWAHINPEHEDSEGRLRL